MGTEKTRRFWPGFLKAGDIQGLLLVPDEHLGIGGNDYLRRIGCLRLSFLCATVVKPLSIVIKLWTLICAMSHSFILHKILLNCNIFKIII